jgi:hypothetical protein
VSENRADFPCSGFDLDAYLEQVRFAISPLVRGEDTLDNLMEAIRSVTEQASAGTFSVEDGQVTLSPSEAAILITCHWLLGPELVTKVLERAGPKPNGRYSLSAISEESRKAIANMLQTEAKEDCDD